MKMWSEGHSLPSVPKLYLRPCWKLWYQFFLKLFICLKLKTLHERIYRESISFGWIRTVLSPWVARRLLFSVAAISIRANTSAGLARRYIHVCTNQVLSRQIDWSENPSNRPVCLSLCLFSVSAGPSVHLCLFVCLSVCLSTCLFPVCLPVCPSICVCLSVCLFVCLFDCLAVMYVSVCLYDIQRTHCIKHSIMSCENMAYDFTI